jgi:hypothetical protein
MLVKVALESGARTGEVVGAVGGASVQEDPESCGELRVAPLCPSCPHGRDERSRSRVAGTGEFLRQ